jgi:hypothetical protein
MTCLEVPSMCRAAFILVLSVSAAVVAAPVVPPSEKELIAKHWGKVHAPSEKYEFKLDGRRLTIHTAGEQTDPAFAGTPLVHPRVSRTVNGDFEATVRVIAAATPNPTVKYVQGSPATRAGLFVAGGNQFAELELLQYYTVSGGVMTENPFRVVWVNTKSKTSNGGHHITHIDPTKPLYLRITRKEKVVSDYYSIDGKTWTPTKWRREIELPNEVTVGIYFAHTTHQIADATFSEYTISKLE